MNKKPTLIWSGNHYSTVNANIQYIDKPMERGKKYIFVVQGLSGSYRMSFPYIYGTGDQFQYGYYDGTTVVRWRILITADGTGFYLDSASLNMGSNTGIRYVYEEN